ncbi:MAG: hypothetical protein RLZZ123_897 [Pseudomonadota bacterium]|jgi:hypothetical protein
MNVLTELLLAILVSALLAVNTVVQTNQTTNETAAIAVGIYLTSVAAAAARYAQANGGAAPTAMSDLSTPGGLGLGSTIPAGNGAPVFGVTNIATGGVNFTSTIAYACTPKPMNIRQVNADDKGRDSLVNAAIIGMSGGGARTYTSNPTVVYGAFGRFDLGASVTGGNGILCAWKNVYSTDLLKSVNTSTATCNTLNQFQIVFSTTNNKPAYCNGTGIWRDLNASP